MTQLELTRAMTAKERGELKEREAVIARGLKTFVDVGTQLTAIRDKRLYRAEYGTFDEYCQGRWGMSPKYGYRLINAAKIVNNSSPTGDILPSSERQARPLARLNADEQRTVWTALVDSTPPKKITAQKVSDAVRKHKRGASQPGERFVSTLGLMHRLDKAEALERELDTLIREVRAALDSKPVDVGRIRKAVSNAAAAYDSIIDHVDSKPGGRR